MRELLSNYSIEDLKNGLNQKEAVKYNKNGNRQSQPNQFLKKIESIMLKAGIKRIADISFLSETGYPVYQSCRPNLMFHSSIGQNTGAQGKGPNSTQAKISCIMETIEGYSAEPRNNLLIRGSYLFLKNQHKVINPQHFIHSQGQQLVQLDEPIMWTKALHLESGSDVLVPAEQVFFPFIPNHYKTLPHFPCGSNGLASGSSYLEAAIHALYEVIERHYLHLFEEGKVHVEALHEEELVNIGIEETKAAVRGEYELQLYAVEIPKIKNLSLVYCTLVGNTVCYYGIGCSSTVEISIDRAISEALQNQATFVSGAREDLDISTEAMAELPSSYFQKIPQPEFRTLRIKDYKKRVHDKYFKDLKSEFDFIVNWIHELGYRDILIANLTRVGIDLPVLKVIIPNMMSEREQRYSTSLDFEKIINNSYPNIT